MKNCEIFSQISLLWFVTQEVKKTQLNLLKILNEWLMSNLYLYIISTSSKIPIFFFVISMIHFIAWIRRLNKHFSVFHLAVSVGRVTIVPKLAH